MATQTGSIDLTASNSVKLMAEAGFESVEQTYATKGELEVTNEQVALRATKAEATQMAQPNLSPFFSMAPTNVYDATTNPDGYWASAVTLEQLADGWAHIDFSNTGTGDRWLMIYEHCAWRHRAGDLKGSTKYTVMFEFRNVTKTGNVTCIGMTQHATSWLSMFIGNSEQGNVAVADGVQYHVGTTVADPTSVTGSKCTTRTLITFPAGSSLDADFRMSLYEGEYAGPYKPYSGDTMYATNSELKVTADGINTEVSKKVGNDEIISKINQSAETVKIQASKVEIDGTAIFSAIKSSADAAYDAKGAAATVQDNLDNLEVGGRNLLPQTQNWGKVSTSNGTGTITSDTKAGCQILKFVWGSGNADVFFTGKWTRPLEANAWYTLSFWARADAAIDLRNYLWSPAVVDDGRNSVGRTTSTVDGAILTPITTSWERYWISWHVKAGSSLPNNVMIGRLQSAGTVYFAGAKFEKGNKATDWTPAPEDQIAYVDSIQVGGRNLAKGTATQASLTQTGTSRWFDPIAIFPTSDVGLALLSNSSNEKFVISFDWAATGVTTAFGMDPALKHTSMSYNPISTAYEISVPTGDSSGHYEKVFTPTDAMRSYGNAWLIRRSTATANTSGTVSISNFMFECANKASTWTPAPEDIEANAVKRTQRIWYRTNASSAPATPGTASSNWVTKADDGSNAWTKMHVSITTSEKYIYTCEQYEMADGTLGHTDVLLDNTITVIDGGNIITGSVRADKLDASDINASKTLTVGAMTDAAAATILNSELADDISDAAKTATNYITAEADGIKIHMVGESTTYQHQTATDTTFYITGKKRTKVGSDGLHIYVDTDESEIASFTSSGAVVGKTAGSHFAQDATTATFYGTNGTDKNLSIETDNGVGVIKFNGDRSSINGFANILGLRSYGSSSSSDNGMITITAESEDVDTATGSVGQTYLWMYSAQSNAHAELESVDGNGGMASVRVDGKNSEVDITGDLKLVNNVLAKAYGGTGNTSGAAAKLVTPRTLYVALGTTYDSTNPVQFDGSANKALPVSGTLPVTRGGTGGTTAAAARANLGAAARSWTSLGSTTGTTAITFDLSSYYEVCVVARYGTSYLGSIVLPKGALHATTEREIYLGGWGNNSTVSNRRAVGKLSQVKFTPVLVTTDQTDRTSSATWVVYAR